MRPDIYLGGGRCSCYFLFRIKTVDELNFLDVREAFEANTFNLVVGGALGARQMHLTPQHGRNSVHHSVSFHHTIPSLASQRKDFGSSCS